MNSIYKEEELIFSGVLFDPGDEYLRMIKKKAHNLCTDYNSTHEDDEDLRKSIINELIGECGENVTFQGPIQFNYGKHTKVGNNCFFNFNLTIQDDAHVIIGNDCNFGPNVTIVTPLHPMLPNERKAIRRADGTIGRLCYAKTVSIGNDCWICSNVIICPGVTIGDNCVIGAGSIVTRDIPANSVAAGTPCKVIRSLSEEDSMRFMPEVLADNVII